MQQEAEVCLAKWKYQSASEIISSLLQFTPLQIRVHISKVYILQIHIFISYIFSVYRYLTILLFFTDYINGGELFTHLYQREKFTENEVRIYIGEIVLALEHLHKVRKSPRYLNISNHDWSESIERKLNLDPYLCTTTYLLT